MPSGGQVTRAQLQSALNQLVIDCVQHVTVTVPSSAAVRGMLHRRKGVRNRNADLLPDIKRRVTPLEQPYAVSFAPRVDPLPLKNIVFPRHKRAPNGDIVFVHPSTRLCHFAVMHDGDPQHGLGRYAAELAARTIHFGDSHRNLESAGIAMQIDSASASMTVAAPVAQATQHIRQLLRRLDRPLDRDAFNVQRKQLINDLRQESTDPVRRCMHEASNRVLRASNPFSYAQAINFVAALTPAKARRCFRANMAASRHLLVQPIL